MDRIVLKRESHKIIGICRHTCRKSGMSFKSQRVDSFAAQTINCLKTGGLKLAIANLWLKTFFHKKIVFSIV
jgi:hypothetical protein